MPPYFKFLTILAFNIFLSEGVDVAIIEVGIGGENDCTNVLRNVSTVGITSLGLEHTTVLGDTIEQIAWQKAGIMKSGSRAFTVKQPAEAMKVLQDRAFEKQCNLSVVPDYNLYRFQEIPELKNNTYVQKMNASLAMQMATHWMASNKIPGRTHEVSQNSLSNSHNECPSDTILDIPNSVAKALADCFWPGRCQIFNYNSNRLFLDGAHTVESIKVCVDWFERNARKDHYKVLIFNITGDRDAKNLLELLHKCNFNEVIFIPNTAYSDQSSNIDQMSYSNPVEKQLTRCQKHKEIWLDIQKSQDSENKRSIVNSTSKELPDSGNNNISNVAHTFDCASDALQYLNEIQKNKKTEVLITGSLYLIGSVLAVVDPNLSISYGS